MNELWESFARSMPPALLAVMILVTAVVVAWVAQWILFFALGRIARRTPWEADEHIVRRASGPARLILILVAVQLVRPTLTLGPRAQALLQHTISLVLIGCITWLVVRLVSVFEFVVLRRHRIDVADNLAARRVHTQIRVIERVVSALVVIVGLAAMLMTFPQIRQLGASLLASAGVAGIVLGLAARPTISNFIAGLQIALTQAIRLDDVVIVQGEWGRIEEITTTYVVVRIWDQRRLIVPFSQFIDQAFQNWTRNSAEILGTVFIYADYTVPVQTIRDRLAEIVKDSPNWDGRVVGLQVTDAKERTVELRALVSAADSSKAWDLRCEVREQLIRYLQESHPQSLARTRVELDRDETQQPKVKPQPPAAKRDA